MYFLLHITILSDKSIIAQGRGVMQWNLLAGKTAGSKSVNISLEWELSVQCLWFRIIYTEGIYSYLCHTLNF